MAMAVVKLNQKGEISEGVSDTIQYFLDRLYINRSGLFCGNICPIMKTSCLQDLNPHADIALQCIARTEYNSDGHGRWHSSTQKVAWKFI